MLKIIEKKTHEQIRTDLTKTVLATYIHQTLYRPYGPREVDRVTLEGAITTCPYKGLGAFSITLNVLMLHGISNAPANSINKVLKQADIITATW